jgi:hypothetical protein
MSPFRSNCVPGLPMTANCSAQSVAFSSIRCSVSIGAPCAMSSTPRIRRILKRFRAGIEATISFLKRSFGLSRCTWTGLSRFRAYCWCSTVAHNLLTIARALLARAKPA